MLLKVMALLFVINVIVFLAVSARPILNEKVNTNLGIDNLVEIVEMLKSCPNCAGNIPDPSCCKT